MFRFGFKKKWKSNKQSKEVEQAPVSNGIKLLTFRPIDTEFTPSASTVPELRAPRRPRVKRNVLEVFRQSYPNFQQTPATQTPTQDDFDDNTNRPVFQTVQARNKLERIVLRPSQEVEQSTLIFMTQDHGASLDKNKKKSAKQQTENDNVEINLGNAFARRLDNVPTIEQQQINSAEPQIDDDDIEINLGTAFARRRLDNVPKIELEQEQEREQHTIISSAEPHIEDDDIEINLGTAFARRRLDNVPTMELEQEREQQAVISYAEPQIEDGDIEINLGSAFARRRLDNVPTMEQEQELEDIYGSRKPSVEPHSNSDRGSIGYQETVDLEDDDDKYQVHVVNHNNDAMSSVSYQSADTLLDSASVLQEDKPRFQFDDYYKFMESQGDKTEHEQVHSTGLNYQESHVSDVEFEESIVIEEKPVVQKRVMFDTTDDSDMKKDKKKDKREAPVRRKSGYSQEASSLFFSGNDDGNDSETSA